MEQEQAGKKSVMAMPEDLGAEAAVLGSMIIDPRCIGKVIEMIDRKAFYHAEHQILWDVVVALYDRNGGSGVDGMLVRAELDRLKRLEEIGGTEYLQKLIESVPSSANAEYYTEIVRSKHQCREIITLGTEALNLAYDGSQDPSEIMSQLEGAIYKLAEGNGNQEASPVMDLVTAAYARIENREGSQVTGLATGFLELDEILCGLQNGDMIIVAGRPSSGKTCLALNVAEHVSMIGGEPALVFSMEMGRDQLVERTICGAAGVDGQKVRKGMLETDDYQRIIEACDRIRQAPLYIDDSCGLTPLLLKSKARRAVRQYGIKLLVVDYLQLMHIPGKVESRTVEITRVSSELKSLARELNLPLVVISQLNRANESRADKRPQMSDLRDSGALEQDADVIMLLHREDYYHKNEPDYIKTNEAEVCVVKQRNGPTGMVKLIFREQLMRFENAAANLPGEPW